MCKQRLLCASLHPRVACRPMCGTEALARQTRQWRTASCRPACAERLCCANRTLLHTSNRNRKLITSSPASNTAMLSQDPASITNVLDTPSKALDYAQHVVPHLSPVSAHALSGGYCLQLRVPHTLRHHTCHSIHATHTCVCHPKKLPTVRGHQSLAAFLSGQVSQLEGLVRRTARERSGPHASLSHTVPQGDSAFASDFPLPDALPAGARWRLPRSD